MIEQWHEWDQIFLNIALLDRDRKSEAVASMLTQIAQPTALEHILTTFERYTESSVHVAADSYTHDNGFDKIVLFEDDTTKMKMRLHIWHPISAPEVTRVIQNVHNHRWDFASIVLLGELVQHTYRFGREDEPGDEYFHYRYYARGNKEHYEMESLGKATLIKTGTEAFCRGQLNCVSNELLHRVDVADGIAAATLIITHENVGWITNDLLSERDLGTDRLRLQSPAMTKQQIVARVDALRSLMSRQP